MSVQSHPCKFYFQSHTLIFGTILMTLVLQAGLSKELWFKFLRYHVVKKTIYSTSWSNPDCVDRMSLRTSNLGMQISKEGGEWALSWSCLSERLMIICLKMPHGCCLWAGKQVNFKQNFLKERKKTLLYSLQKWSTET